MAEFKPLTKAEPLTKTERLKVEQSLIEIAARLSAAAHYAERIAECFALGEIGEHVAHSHRVSLVENIVAVGETLSAIDILPPPRKSIYDAEIDRE